MERHQSAKSVDNVTNAPPTDAPLEELQERHGNGFSTAVAIGTMALRAIVQAPPLPYSEGVKPLAGVADDSSIGA